MNKTALIIYTCDSPERNFELSGRAYAEGFKSIISNNYSDEEIVVTKEDVLVKQDNPETVVESLKALGYDVIPAEEYYRK